MEVEQFMQCTILFGVLKTEALPAKKVTCRRVPEGTSDYQAAWITNSDDEGDPDDDEKDDDDLHEEIAEGSDSDQSMVTHVWISI